MVILIGRIHLVECRSASDDSFPAVAGRTFLVPKQTKGVIISKSSTIQRARTYQIQLANPSGASDLMGDEGTSKLGKQYKSMPDYLRSPYRKNVWLIQWSILDNYHGKIKPNIKYIAMGENKCIAGKGSLSSLNSISLTLEGGMYLEMIFAQHYHTLWREIKLLWCEVSFYTQLRSSMTFAPFVAPPVTVCDICGDVGLEKKLAICSKCNDGAEHIYCMRVILEEVPEGDWMCEDCMARKAKKNIAIPNIRKGKNLGLLSKSVPFDNVSSVKLSGTSSEVIQANAFRPVIHRGESIASTCVGIQAHVSTYASKEVLALVDRLPDIIVLEELPRLRMWPSQFMESRDTEENIALYFFAEDLHRTYYRGLIEYMNKNDLALKGNMDGIELLIFPSNRARSSSDQLSLGGVDNCNSGCSDSRQSLDGKEKTSESVLDLETLEPKSATPEVGPWLSVGNVGDKPNKDVKGKKPVEENNNADNVQLHDKLPMDEKNNAGRPESSRHPSPSLVSSTNYEEILDLPDWQAVETLFFLSKR
ncbi:Tyrosine-protein kinase BAZ1B, partial [Mucuna pruriens]